MTPEGKVKRAVSQLLLRTERLYYHMPVPGGYGGTTLDYIGCHRGDFFAIETKAPGQKPTARQRTIIEMMERSGAQVFVIDSEDVSQLENWLKRESWFETHLEAD